ncbi:histidine phosphatase family protein [Acetobacter oeni]|uniref:Phosphoglycerate mutase n=1 Tax=Acetobacter oeni TaxID=304077 RepID=A0A511XK82_9PROT|nr:histidine phosphatase family protein [Acetobacter oeni]MBB3883159.1 broad specificity phosphatase PhoE [Acetobacter oeni]NHO19201.1 histidine phosphatase family protein [Acetobacter oeni]GBR05134.1 phosphoglycerate mutase [Acetobacter oeni LMG 21952]GEN63339.1 phosphoglycerate mutase [Acetobacter oeni]
MGVVSSGFIPEGQQNHGNFLDAPKLEAGITRFWLIRHALVEQNARAMLYGTMDVPLCPESLIAQQSMYEALARRLPSEALWFITPLRRTRRTAETIQNAGYGARGLIVESDLVEQDLGNWQGLPHGELPGKLKLPPHQFWPLSGSECPPGGESMVTVCTRVGAALDRLAEENASRDMVVVSHGGAIRAALAHALRISPDTALHFSVQNLSLTILECHDGAWRVVTVNELPGI